MAAAAGFAHSTPENYYYDAAAMDWHGWMLVGEFADKPEDNDPAEMEYIKVAVDQFDRLNDDGESATLLEGH
jgi:hypothetical protein